MRLLFKAPWCVCGRERREGAARSKVAATVSGTVGVKKPERERDESAEFNTRHQSFIENEIPDSLVRLSCLIGYGSCM